MDQKVQKYLQESKDRELIKRGLTVRKYFEPGEVTNEMEKKLAYTYSESKKNYYELIPCNVTDEEFRQILQIPYKSVIRNSKLPSIFYFLGGTIIIVGIFGGIAFASPASYMDSFNWQLAFIVWFSSLFLSLNFVGLGRIIDLLEELNHN